MPFDFQLEGSGSRQWRLSQSCQTTGLRECADAVAGTAPAVGGIHLEHTPRCQSRRPVDGAQARARGQGPGPGSLAGCLAQLAGSWAVAQESRPGALDRGSQTQSQTGPEDRGVDAPCAGSVHLHTMIEPRLLTTIIVSADPRSKCTPGPSVPAVGEGGPSARGARPRHTGVGDWRWAGRSKRPAHSQAPMVSGSPQGSSLGFVRASLRRLGTPTGGGRAKA